VATGSSDFEFIVAKKPDSIPSESFRALRTRVQFSRVDTEALKTILITSSAPSEGKTMVCTNLAGSFAFSNKKTIIVDCDLRKPRIHSFFKTNRYPGLVDYLFGQVSFDEIVRQSEIPDLWYITAGTIPPNPSEILESQKMRDFLATVREKYDYILIDSPPVIAVTDSEILARYADATALVVSANTTEVELLIRSLEIIQQENINFIGAILNNFVYKSSYGSYYKYYYYYTRPRKADKSKLPPSQLTT
jgi:capsular exopolysaccharide synthesis family protein